MEHPCSRYLVSGPTHLFTIVALAQDFRTQEYLTKTPITKHINISQPRLCTIVVSRVPLTALLNTIGGLHKQSCWPTEQAACPSRTCSPWWPMRCRCGSEGHLEVYPETGTWVSELPLSLHSPPQSWPSHLQKRKGKCIDRAKIWWFIMLWEVSLCVHKILAKLLIVLLWDSSA